MTLSEDTKNTKTDEASWAKPVSKLSVAEAPLEAMNLNVEGRGVVGPLQGFGQLWQKTYKVQLSGADVKPTEVIKEWKAKLGKADYTFLRKNQELVAFLLDYAP